MKTRSDLIVASLELLNAIAAAQEPSAEDVSAIDKLIDGQLSELNRRKVFSANSKTQFDDDYVDPLAIIMANAAAPSFGQPRNPASKLEAENRLREMRTSDWLPSDVIPTQYF